MLKVYQRNRYNCSNLKKHGKFIYFVDEEFEGTLPVPLGLQDFPFDKQYFPVELNHSQQTGNEFHYWEWLGFSTENFADRFYNSEWTIGGLTGYRFSIYEMIGLELYTSGSRVV